DAGDVDATLQLPALHVDPRRSVWGTLHELARRTGHQITSTAAGAVSFGPAPGVPATSGVGGLAAVGAAAVALGPPSSGGELREGAELVAFRAGTRTPLAAVASVSPAGPASWYLLAAEPDSGSGDPVVVDPLLRTREAADAAS